MRTGVESSNAEIKKNHAFMDRGYTHVFGLAKNTLLLAFGLASVNIRLLRHWHARRGQPDPWAAELLETRDLPPLPSNASPGRHGGPRCTSLSPNADHRARRTTPDISTTAR